MSAECFIKSLSILIWNSFSDKFTFLKGCQRAAFTALRLKKIETKLKFPAFFKRNGEEVRGMAGKMGARLHPGNLFREVFLKALAVQKSVFPRSTMYLLVLAFPFSRDWAVVFQCRRYLSMGKSFFIRFSQFETASASHYPREELC